jgi:hypothetical protein
MKHFKQGDGTFLGYKSTWKALNFSALHQLSFTKEYKNWLQVAYEEVLSMIESTEDLDFVLFSLYTFYFTQSETLEAVSVKITPRKFSFSYLKYIIKK